MKTVLVVVAALVAGPVVALLHRGSNSTPALAPTTVRSTLAPGILPRHIGGTFPYRMHLAVRLISGSGS